MPSGRRIEFDDLVHGPQSFLSDDIGDFIIRREDGSAAFFFCNAVDDALMQITHVLRGEDHLSNTPRQWLLLEALRLPAPELWTRLAAARGRRRAAVQARGRAGACANCASAVIPVRASATICSDSAIPRRCTAAELAQMARPST